MAIAVVWVKDKQSSADPYLDVQRWQPGDVIECVPDDHVFTDSDRSNPAWMFVRVPGEPVEALAELMKGDPDEVAKDIPDRMRRIRTHRVDLAAMIASPKPSGQRQNTVTLTAKADLTALKVETEKRPDPNGPDLSRLNLSGLGGR